MSAEVPFSSGKPGDDESLRSLLDSLEEIPVESLNETALLLRRRGTYALALALSGTPRGYQDDPSILETIQLAVGNHLNEFNEERQLLNKGDRIIVRGTLYARLIVPGEWILETPLEPRYHLSGEFSEMISMAAPPVEKLAEENPALYITGKNHFVPAIRLHDVTINETRDDRVPNLQVYPSGSLDVPLLYTDVDFQRIGQE